MEIFVGHDRLPFTIRDLSHCRHDQFPGNLARTSQYLTHEVFIAIIPSMRCCGISTGSRRKDLSLVHSMIPLGPAP